MKNPQHILPEPEGYSNLSFLDGFLRPGIIIKPGEASLAYRDTEAIPSRISDMPMEMRRRLLGFAG